MDSTVDVLNQILGGEHMAVDIYDTYINSLHDPELRDELQKFQQDHKEHAQKLSAYIQDLGGKPHENRGWVGLMATTMGKINTFFEQEPVDILTELYNGEDKGLAKALELAEQVDPETRSKLEDLFSADHDHLKQLQELIRRYPH